MLNEVIRAYHEARRVWEARFAADDVTAGESPEWDAFMKAEEGVFYAPCATIEEVREKVRFVLRDDNSLDSLTNCYREIDGEQVPSLKFFLEAVLPEQSRNLGIDEAILEPGEVCQPASVETAIAAHRAAVDTDEASFDENGNAISVDLEQVTGKAEIEAYKAFVSMPCQTADDVQAKLKYLLNGSVGDRSKFIECLTEVSYGEPLKQFLRSLLVEAR